MTRNEAIALLEKYNEHLLKEEYVDADFYAEHDVTAIDSFLATKWAKDQFPVLVLNPHNPNQTSWFYKNCVRQRKRGAKICQCCPFRKQIEENE